MSSWADEGTTDPRAADAGATDAGATDAVRDQSEVDYLPAELHPFPPLDPARAVYCNRTVNLRRIRAIGYDMDYTLVHYRVDEWERAAFEHARGLLAARGWPVEQLSFDPTAYIQGLVFDLERGNILKATRFGYVIRAHHGTRPLTFPELREAYDETFVHLGEERFQFMNTLFSLSQASLFAQLVDLADEGRLPGPTGYLELWRVLGEVLEESHTQGQLKASIVADPERFVEPDADLPLTLLDQREAGKQLLLVTNSDWSYTQAMMTFAVEPYLPEGMSWRELFHTIIVDADKPRFFSAQSPVYRVVEAPGLGEDGASLSPGASPARGASTPDGGSQPLLQRHRGLLQPGGIYAGGDARLVERSLGLSGSEILYLGDHLFGDVHVTGEMLRWRTGLILRELEAEVRAATAFTPIEVELAQLMEQKKGVDRELAILRLARLRRRRGHGPILAVPDLAARVEEASARAAALDAAIAPLARAAGRIGNQTWGPLMRAGGDRSLFARQVERYADLYTSRVSNLLHETPFAYLRAVRTNLPHDPM